MSRWCDDVDEDIDDSATMTMTTTTMMMMIVMVASLRWQPPWLTDGDKFWDGHDSLDSQNKI